MPTMDSIHVTATVLTYDAPDALAHCLDALNSQMRPPDRVLVVDNHGAHTVTSDDARRDRLVVEVIRTEDNLGPAGGHAVALSAFLGSDSDVVWVMDDDIEPRPDCLDKLLKAAHSIGGPALVFPRTLDRVGKDASYPGWQGFVMTREAVVAAGLPKAELVWWVEDTEYLQHRAPRAGVAVSRDERAIVVHRAARRSGSRPSSRYYYEGRNTTYYRLHVQKPRKVAKFALAAARLYLRPWIRHESDRFLKTLRMTQGISDGLRARLGKRFEM